MLVVASGVHNPGLIQDLIGAALYLLSPASDFCTGQVLYIDGGYTAG
jgi:enoyl-[acyl-carrier-protein] reductase (NADH)